jgi:hypothetical protein
MMQPRTQRQHNRRRMAAAQSAQADFVPFQRRVSNPSFSYPASA